MHQRSPLKKFEEKSDNTVKLCLSIFTCYNVTTRATQIGFNQFKYNLDDFKFEVHDIKHGSSITYDY